MAKQTDTVLEMVRRLFEQEQKLAEQRARLVSLQDRIDLAMEEGPVCRGKTGSYTLCPQCTILRLGITEAEHNRSYEHDR